jgi:hypothetical protein
MLTPSITFVHNPVTFPGQQDWRKHRILEESREGVSTPGGGEGDRKGFLEMRPRGGLERSDDPQSE